MKPELEVHLAKQMLDLGAVVCLDLLGFVQQVAPIRVLVHCQVLTLAHDDMPVNTGILLSLNYPLVAGIPQTLKIIHRATSHDLEVYQTKKRNH